MGSPKLSYASTSGRVRIGAEDCLVGDNTLSSSLAFAAPVSMCAQDPNSAMLRSNGVGVFLNDNPAPAATALFRDDLIRTEKTPRQESSSAVPALTLDLTRSFSLKATNWFWITALCRSILRVESGFASVA